MFQFLLERSLVPGFFAARAAHAVARRVARVHDPLVTYRLNGRALALPLSHDLPWNRRVHPTYLENLRRLAAAVRASDGGLRMIDVGANVGDSWALARGGATDTFLLVEGSPRYFALLERNTRGEPGVERVCRLLSDRACHAAVEIVLDSGNARLVPAGPGGATTEFDTLDRLLASHPGFRSANLLKVDVEGADARVLRGGRRLLEEAQPVILFEHQPAELARAGEDDAAVFAELAALGYHRFILYDNRGLLAGEASVEDRDRLGQLLGYARQQEGYYYDVCAFPDSRGGWRETFRRAELTFYAELERGAFGRAASNGD